MGDNQVSWLLAGKKFPRSTNIPKSVWRPLFGPLQDWPLGVLDYTSLDVTNDLIASDNIYPYEIKENYNVFYNPKHHWCYLSDHEPNELLLFKAFDTERGPGVARGELMVPHRFRALLIVFINSMPACCILTSRYAV